MTIAEAARLAGVSEGALRKRVRRGTLPVVRTVERGRVVQRIPVEALRADYQLDVDVAPVGDAGQHRGTAPADTPTAPQEEHLRERLAVVAARHGALGREARQLRDQLRHEREERVQLAHALGQARERLRRLEALPAHEEPVGESRGRPLAWIVGGALLVGLVAAGGLAWRTAREADVQLSRAEAVAQRAGRELGEAQALRAGAGEALSAALQEREEAARLVAQVEVERQLQRQARVVFEVERRVLRLVELVVLGRR